MSAAIEILKYTIGPFEENAYLLVGPSGQRALLVDPGIGSEEILDVLKERGLELALIVNTHGHLDHVAGNAFFKQHTEAPLVIHRLDVPYLERVAQQAALLGMKAPNSPPPDDFLEEGKPLKFDGLEFEVLHTPGHTPGGVCLRLDDRMWVGDTLFSGSIGRTDLPGGSWPALLRSIREKLFALPDHIICYTGHGEETTLGEERRTNPFVSDAAIAAAKGMVR